MMYLLQAKDEDSFFRYVHLFVEYFSRSHNNDKDLELSQLPDSLLKELSEYLNRQTYSKLSGLTVKQRTHTICAVRCLSTLARYVMMKLPLEWLVETSSTSHVFHFSLCLNSISLPGFFRFGTSVLKVSATIAEVAPKYTILMLFHILNMTVCDIGDTPAVFHSPCANLE